MSHITLQSEKYFALKQKVEAVVVRKHRSREAIHAFLQFSVAVGLILLIVNYAGQFTSEIQAVHHWVGNSIR